MRPIIFLKKGINACTHYRVDIPNNYLKQLKEDISIIKSVDEINLSTIKDQIFIFGRACLKKELEIFREIKRRGGIVIYEVDDDLLDLPYWNPASTFYLKVQVFISLLPSLVFCHGLSFGGKIISASFITTTFPSKSFLGGAAVLSGAWV